MGLIDGRRTFAAGETGVPTVAASAGGGPTFDGSRPPRSPESPAGDRHAFPRPPPRTRGKRNGAPMTVLDVQLVPVSGDPSQAVIAAAPPAAAPHSYSDVLVVGGGTGGVAAALSAARHGMTVTVLEETAWLGGQLTAQGVSALDEHVYIEQSGGTRSYYELRERIRSHYAPLSRSLATDPAANPGNCWVSRLAFEPRVGLHVVQQMIYRCRDRIDVRLRRKAIVARVDGDTVVSVLSVGLEDGHWDEHTFRFVIDATEFGDLLPMTGCEHTVGAEARSDTGEPHAREIAHRGCVQSFTYPAAVTCGSTSDIEVGPSPPGYEHNKASQPYSLRIHVVGGEIYGDESGWLSYGVFDQLPGTRGSLWSYRRLLDPSLFDTPVKDLSILNWPGNDYRHASLLDHTPLEQAVALQEAKWTSLGFVHWLRAEADRPGGSQGYPEIALSPETYGTSDGLPMHPYIRESRRIIPIRQIREQDVASEHQQAARAAHFSDTVGIGWYPIDIHGAHADDRAVSMPTKPFQIALGALVPVRLRNLLAGAKNIGTTHLTNGCYRLHPVEWNIGEAAGTIAAFCVAHRCLPRDLVESTTLLRDVQELLVRQGVPLVWYSDVGVEHPEFERLQLETIAGQVQPDPETLLAGQLVR